MFAFSTQACLRCPLIRILQVFTLRACTGSWAWSWKRSGSLRTRSGMMRTLQPSRMTGSSRPWSSIGSVSSPSPCLPSLPPLRSYSRPRTSSSHSRIKKTKGFMHEQNFWWTYLNCTEGGNWSWRSRSSRGTDTCMTTRSPPRSRRTTRSWRPRFWTDSASSLSIQRPFCAAGTLATEEWRWRRRLPGRRRGERHELDVISPSPDVIRTGRHHRQHVQYCVRRHRGPPLSVPLIHHSHKRSRINQERRFMHETKTC